MSTLHIRHNNLAVCNLAVHAVSQTCRPVCSRAATCSSIVQQTSERCLLEVMCGWCRSGTQGPASWRRVTYLCWISQQQSAGGYELCNLGGSSSSSGGGVCSSCSPGGKAGSGGGSRRCSGRFRRGGGSGGAWRTSSPPRSGCRRRRAALAACCSGCAPWSSAWRRSGACPLQGLFNAPFRVFSVHHFREGSHSCTIDGMLRSANTSSGSICHF